MKPNFNLFICVFFLVLTCTSCKKNTNNPKHNVVNVGDAVGKYHTLQLSDFVESIEYIPLETNDSVLITKIIQISFENEKIVINDDHSLCKVFDNKGSYLFSLGKIGQGVNEYIALHEFDFNPAANTISLYANPGKLLTYNIESENLYVKSENFFFEEDIIATRIIHLDTNLYFSDIVSRNDTKIKNAIIEINKGKPIIKKLYYNSVFIDKKDKSGYSLVFEKGTMFRYKNNIRAYKVLNDTIFSFNKEEDMKGEFIFDFGQYRATNEWLLEKIPNKELKYIWPLNIQESSNYLFMEFFFGNHAPNPFDYVQQYSMGKVPKTNYNVFGLYNKETGLLKLMDNPAKNKQGFKNDIDQGIAIWPQYISSNDCIVTYCEASDFIAYYSNISQPSDKIKKILNVISEDSNPIIIIAKLKK